jgi:metal-responsive CopG/Arc/MetJ family transcriptional regulator
MKKPNYRRKKLIAFTDKMAADMRSFCRDKGIKSESELIRQAVAKYIYADDKGKTPDRHVLKQMQDILSRCELSISFK